jgi:hypothetical protein
MWSRDAVECNDRCTAPTNHLDRDKDGIACEKA